MGKLIQFPCRDYYENYEYEYEEYYGNSEEFEDDYGNDCGWNGEVEVRDGLVRGFVRKVLMFILVRL